MDHHWLLFCFNLEKKWKPKLGLRQIYRLCRSHSLFKKLRELHINEKILDRAWQKHQAQLFLPVQQYGKVAKNENLMRSVRGLAL